MTPILRKQLEQIRDGTETRPVFCLSVFNEAEMSAITEDECKLIKAAANTFLGPDPVRQDGD